MTKYEIRTDHFEFRLADRVVAFTGSEIMDTYFSCDTRITSNILDPAFRESFTEEEEAVQFFPAHYDNYGGTRLQKSNVGYLLTGEIAWLEENDYDEEGEFDCGGGVIIFSAEDFSPEPDEEED